MTLRSVFITFGLVIGLAVGPSTPTLLAQSLTAVRAAAHEFTFADTEGFRVVTTRTERAGQTSEHSVIEGPSVNGGSTVLSAVEDHERQIGAETSRRTRREFITDTNGRSSLVSTLEEHRTARANGGERIIRDVTEPDVNGRARVTRREHEDTIARGDGIFITRIEVSEPTTRGNNLVATERIEQRERRDVGQVLERDRTTYTNPGGGDTWVAQERRVLTRTSSDGDIHSVEVVYRADDAGRLVQSDRIVSRQWAGPGGQEHRTEETFSRDIPDEVRAGTPRLSRRIETVTTGGLDGRSSTTRTVQEPRNGRIQVVERVIERVRPGGRGETVIQQETQQLDVNGRLQTARVIRTRESAM